MRWLPALVVTVVLAGPALAEERARPPADAPPAVEQFDAALEQALEAFHRLLRAIPRFEMPEITDQGDIIIRRKHPEVEAPQVDTART